MLQLRPANTIGAHRRAVTRPRAKRSRKRARDDHVGPAIAYKETIRLACRAFHAIPRVSHDLAARNRRKSTLEEPRRAVYPSRLRAERVDN